MDHELWTTLYAYEFIYCEKQLQNPQNVIGTHLHKWNCCACVPSLPSSSTPVKHCSLQIILYGTLALLRPNRVEDGSLQVKEKLKGRLFILGVSSHANARDKEHCSKQHDSALPERGGRWVVFGHIYTWNISLVMEENQRIKAHQHRGYYVVLWVQHHPDTISTLCQISP